MKTPIHTFTNSNTGMESYVYAADRGGYNVTVRDLDSGEYLPSVPNFREVADAETFARKVVAN